MMRPSVWGSWSLPIRATAPPDRSAPRWRARRTSDSRLTTSPAISSSMRSPRSRDSVSVRTSSRARSRATASASSATTAAWAGASGHGAHTTRTPIAPARAVDQGPADPRHLLLDEGADDRGRAVAARAHDRGLEEGVLVGRQARGAADVQVLVEDRDRRAEQLRARPRRGPGGCAPRPAAPAAPSARRAPAARVAPPAIAVTSSAITAPHGVPGASTSAGTPRSLGGAVRQTTATQPGGSGLGGAPGHAISAPASGGASASATTRADTGTSSDAEAGITRTPASAGIEIRCASSVRSSAAVAGACVVTGQTMGGSSGRFQGARPAGGACLSTWRKMRAPRLAPCHKAPVGGTVVISGAA